MSSVNLSRAGEFRQVQSAVCLIWVHQQFSVYRHLGQVVLREVCRYLQAQPSLLMLITKFRIRVFSFAERAWSREIALSQMIKDIELVQATPLSESQMLICGGVKDNTNTPLRTAYQISVKGAVAVLPKMRHGRYAHGLIAYQHSAYVFGGNDVAYTLQNSCEQLTLSNSQWEALPDMNQKRSHFYPAVYHGQIYLCGGSPISLEAFDPTTRTFSSLPLELGGSSNCILFVRNDELCIVNAEWIGTAKLQGSEMKLVRGRKRYSLWPESQCTPIIYGDSLYYIGNQTFYKSHLRR